MALDPALNKTESAYMLIIEYDDGSTKQVGSWPSARDALRFGAKVCNCDDPSERGDAVAYRVRKITTA